MSETPDVDELLARAYALDGPDANRALYADWAATYDDTFVAASAYVYHRRVAAEFVNRFGRGAVLDVGCGTGIVGIALREAGLDGGAPIDGLDISSEMLARAAAKTTNGSAVYRTTIEADLTRPVDLPSDAYAGIVSAGTFTHGHLGPDALDELFRVAAPGATCVIGVNAAHFVSLGFGPFLDARRRDGPLAELDLVTIPIYAGSDPGEPDQMAELVVATVR